MECTREEAAELGSGPAPLVDPAVPGVEGGAAPPSQPAAALPSPILDAVRLLLAPPASSGADAGCERGAAADLRPSELWGMCFAQRELVPRRETGSSTAGGSGERPANVVVAWPPSPVTGVPLRTVDAYVAAAEEVFQQVCPGAPFLPKPKRPDHLGPDPREADDDLEA
jgi:hypothetical protein